MTLSPQKFREIVYMALFSAVFCEEIPEDLTHIVMRQSLISKKNASLAVERAKKIFALRNELERLISQASKEYSLERIAQAEKVALYLSLYELLFDEAIPPKVAISEGVRIARKYATPSAGQFVNAVLDNLYQESKIALGGE